jgi:pimeloyl-ACP methyl ester carboxylesterase
MDEIRTRTVEANGLSFVVDETGEGDDVALFLHGFPESRWSWRHQMPLLASLGWRAVAPDLRGYGQSSRPAGVEPYRMEHLVEDTAALFEALGAKRRLLIGHDWGSLIAWSFAIERRLPLDGLVIMNAPHPATLARARKNPRQWLRSWYVFYFQIPWLPEAAVTAFGGRAVNRAFRSMAVDKSRFTDEALEPYRKNALIPGAMTAMINYYRANFGDLNRYGEDSPIIEVPTLMVWGEEDAAIGIEFTQGYEDLVSDFTLNRLPNVSHWVQQEAPEAVNARLEAWMRAKGFAR